MSKLEPRTRVLRLASRSGTVTTRQVVDAGLHRQILTRMVDAGELERVSRGVYAVAGHAPTEHHGLILASAAIPSGVVCLLSALSFHGIGTELPSDVWLALDRRTHAPKLEYPRIRLVRMSGDAMTQGVRSHRLEGRTVRVYTVAKTLADCFKFRSKIGLDVALEALRDAWQKRAFTLTEIDRHASTCRVQRVMKPYLESLIG